jgi:hypothetical protein
MKFKDFFHIDELVGQYGNVKAVCSPLGIHRAIRKGLIPTGISRGRTSVSRMLSAGKFRSPSRPSRITGLNRSTTTPSVL